MGDSFFSGSKFVRELTSKNFDSSISKNLKDMPGCAIVLFYAPWCGYCKKVKESWEALGKKATFFEVCAMDCTAQAAQHAKIKEDYPGLIGGFPTIVFYKDGKPVENYEGDRTLKNLFSECLRVCEDQNKT